MPRVAKTSARHVIITLAFGVFGWLLCGIVKNVSLYVYDPDVALLANAAAAPIFFSLIIHYYNRRHCYFSPTQTAVMVTGVFAALEFFVSALLLQGDLHLFAGLLGAWIPFTLVFIASWLTGLYCEEHENQAKDGHA